MVSLPGILLVMRRIVFPIMVLLSFIIIIGPVEKILYILKDDAWRKAVDEDSHANMDMPNLLDVEGMDANQRALRAAVSSLFHFIPGTYSRPAFHVLILTVLRLTAIIWAVVWPLQVSNCPVCLV